MERLVAAIEPDEVVLGGGNVHKLKKLPPGCRAGDNANAFRRRISLVAIGAKLPLGPQTKDSLKKGITSMKSNFKPLTQRAAWKSLAAHSKQIKKLHLRKLFAEDAKRGERFTAEAAGLFLDYSKNRITEKTLKLLLQLAKESNLRAKMDAMFSGEKINVTENRAVLHVALRAPKSTVIRVDGKNVVPEVHAVLDRMADFANRVRSGEWKGHTGKPIRNVVNIGIGGSDLGPVMAYEALRHYSERNLTFRFVSNVDGIDFVEAVHESRPGGNDVHRFVQDFYDAGNHDQCGNRAQLAAQGTRKRCQGGGKTFRGSFHQRRKSFRLRH